MLVQRIEDRRDGFMGVAGRFFFKIGLSALFPLYKNEQGFQIKHHIKLYFLYFWTIWHHLFIMFLVNRLKNTFSSPFRILLQKRAKHVPWFNKSIQLYSFRISWHVIIFFVFPYNVVLYWKRLWVSCILVLSNDSMHTWLMAQWT